MSEVKYICPQDYYGGSVKKGDIFVAMRNPNYYCPENQNNDTFTGRFMPIEIVETWEKYNPS